MILLTELIICRFGFTSFFYFLTVSGYDFSLSEGKGCEELAYEDVLASVLEMFLLIYLKHC